jgi:outer membrane protein assembly factor BamD
MIKPLLYAVTLAAFVLPMDAAVLFQSREGWSVEGDPTSANEQAAVALMQKAESDEAAGQRSNALAGYKTLVKRYPVSVLAGKAQRKVGLILEAAGEYDDAYEAYAAYLTKYPKGDDFEQVVESMYKIAKLFLDGEKKKLFGVKIASSMQRAQEMFEGIVKRAPFSKYAPLAAFSAGQAMEKQGKNDLALQAYSAVVSRYPNDPIADDALYQIGYVRLQTYRQGSYDQGSAQKAREAFEDFINRYPDSEKVTQARENLKTLEGGASKGSLEIAKYYDKVKQFRAAVIYYNEIIKTQPDSPEANFAKTRIEELRQKHGEDALKSAPERAETGEKAAIRRRLQAKVDTAARPDYVGPPVALPRAPDEVAPGRPRLRTSPIGPVPAVEPELPAGSEKPAEDAAPTPNQ